jgi:hypothetical protein
MITMRPLRMIAGSRPLPARVWRWPPCETWRGEAFWFAAHIADVTSDAGPRYQPELNVEVPVSSQLGAFGETPAGELELALGDELRGDGLDRIGAELLAPPGQVLLVELRGVGDLRQVGQLVGVDELRQQQPGGRPAGADLLLGLRGAFPRAVLGRAGPVALRPNERQAVKFSRGQKSK